MAYAGTGGTVGAAGPLSYTTGVDPTTNSQYAATGTFISNPFGVLTVSMADVHSGAVADGVRLNAFQIDGPAAPTTGPPILRVDFNDVGPSPTQSGFESYAEVGNPGTRSFATSVGTLDVTVSGHQSANVGGFFDRGVPDDNGSFTFGNVYRDFAFHNANSTVSVAIDGLEAETPYEITWYVYDRFDGGGSGPKAGLISPMALSNTFGDTLTTFYDTTIDPVSNEEHAYTGIWSSLDSSLEFDFAATLGNEVRVNGFEIAYTLRRKENRKNGGTRG